MADSLYRDTPDTWSWPHGEMVDMARTPDPPPPPPDDAPAPPAPPAPPQPQYPWGLSICLGDDELDKLGLSTDQLPDVGDILEAFTTSKVTSVSCTENVDPATGQPKKCCRVELQIVGMKVHGEEPEAVDRIEEEQARSRGRRQRFYGETMSEDVPSYDRD